MTFEHYADYYDILYQDKDYEAECDFLEQIVDRYAQRPIRTILDLGCGTGGHALPLARRGYEVMGIDRSEKMLATAWAKATSASESSNVPKFQCGDIRNIDLGRTFDAVIAMFAVISYQTTNEDLAAAFRTARRHLEPGGLFMFDCWFGPAVLTRKPSNRYKVVERDGERIIRFASSTLDILQHIVQVDYKVLWLKDGRVLDEVDESHLMRFLFPKEVEFYLEKSGLKLLRLCPFLRLEAIVTEADWSVGIIALRQ